MINPFLLFLIYFLFYLIIYLFLLRSSLLNNLVFILFFEFACLFFRELDVFRLGIVDLHKFYNDNLLMMAYMVPHVWLIFRICREKLGIHNSRRHFLTKEILI